MKDAQDHGVPTFSLIESDIRTQYQVTETGQNVVAWRTCIRVPRQHLETTYDV